MTFNRDGRAFSTPRTDRERISARTSLPCGRERRGAPAEGTGISEESIVNHQALSSFICPPQTRRAVTTHKSRFWIDRLWRVHGKNNVIAADPMTHIIPIPGVCSR
jgi:hypothetical protein